MQAKLGLPEGLDDVLVAELIAELLGLLQTHRVDYTAFFRSLSGAARGDAEPVQRLFPEPALSDEWLSRWRGLNPQASLMDTVNPVYIPRNHLVEEALSAATSGDLAPFAQLLEAVAAPYDERAGLERYAEAAPADFGAYTTFCGT